MRETGAAERRGSAMVLEGKEMRRLKRIFSGEVITPEHAEYQEARSVWNGMIDRRPRLVLRCRTPSDVQAAVRFARESGTPFSVRSVGHNIAGSALCDDLVIDLSRMRGIDVDPAARRIRAEPGLDWGALDGATQPFGLAVPGGIVSTTGIAGLTVGGGFGWLTRKFGLTCDSVRSMDVVLADGRAVRVSHEAEPELFWALRGGGGNFGIVTRFEYQAYPVGPEVVAGLVLHPLERGREVLDLFRELTADAPDELSALAVLRRTPDSPALPEVARGRLVAGLALCHIGSPADGRRVAERVAGLGAPLVGAMGSKPFVEHQRMLDAGQPSGRRYYWKSEYLSELPDALFGRILEGTGDLPSPHSGVLLMHLGGEARRRIHAGAASHRDAEYVLNIQSSWTDSSQDELQVAWTRAFWHDIAPFSTGGTYLNFLTADDSEERIRAAYGPAHDRLARAKARYDPTNLFRPIQNIRPLAAKEGRR